MPAKTFSEPISLTNQAVAGKLPTTYILTVDKGKPPEQDDFYPFYQRAKAGAGRRSSWKATTTSSVRIPGTRRAAGTGAITSGINDFPALCWQVCSRGRRNVRRLNPKTEGEAQKSAKCGNRNLTHQSTASYSDFGLRILLVPPAGYLFPSSFAFWAWYSSAEMAPVSLAHCQVNQLLADGGVLVLGFSLGAAAPRCNSKQPEQQHGGQRHQGGNE